MDAITCIREAKTDEERRCSYVALMGLMKDPSTKPTIVLAGGIDAILDALGVDSTQYFGWAALNELMHEDVAAVDAAVAAGCIPLAIRALQDPKQSMSVVSVVCTTVYRLTLNPTNKAAIVAAGGVEAIVDATATPTCLNSISLIGRITLACLEDDTA